MTDRGIVFGLSYLWIDYYIVHLLKSAVMKPKSKINKAFRRLRVKTPILVDQTQMDQHIIDTVLKTLYNNSDKDTLSLENEIYKPYKIRLPLREAERLWNIMTSTGLISPVIGFGNAGRVELTRSGYQLMSQFGSYKDYLASLNNHQPQTVILPIQIDSDNSDDENNEHTELKNLEKKRAKKED
jgi:hypothetical protein